MGGDTYTVVVITIVDYCESDLQERVFPQKKSLNI